MILKRYSIQIITVAHGEAQLRGRWGANGARVIMDTSGAKIWLPGISDPDTLDAASRLCGTTAMKETRSSHQLQQDYRDFYARHQVLTAEMIRQLPDRHALIIRGGMSPVIARLPMAWKDPGYKTARRAHQATATLAAVPEPDEFPDDTPQRFRRVNGWDIEPWEIPADPVTEEPGHYPWQ
jgi:type IV secretory pathway TraG/TraD family ATPase VirD4